MSTFNLRSSPDQKVAIGLRGRSRSADHCDRRSRKQELPSIAFGASIAQCFQIAIVKDMNAHCYQHKLVNWMDTPSTLVGNMSLATSLPRIATSCSLIHLAQEACSPAEFLLTPQGPTAARRAQRPVRTKITSPG